MKKTDKLIWTDADKCRACYTCVRECPAKAIRIHKGRAEVMSELCIGCGNCVRVCGRGAKRFYDSTREVLDLLASGAETAALVAPSWPCQFPEWDQQRLVGTLRALGFKYVHEVAFGADLVSQRYQELLTNPATTRLIAATCPAVVSHITKYFPDLVPNLAPVVSPMAAAARVARRLHGAALRVVFIGPCVAKKLEALDMDVDAALTFSELDRIFGEKTGTSNIVPSDFDPPRAGKGRLYPIGRGLLQSAGIPEDLLTGNAVSAEGRTEFVEAIREFRNEQLNTRLLEVTSCMGCIMGPGIDKDIPLFNRRFQVSRCARVTMAGLDTGKWYRDVESFRDLDLSRVYKPDPQPQPEVSETALKEVLSEMGKNSAEDELNCGACGYDTCRAHASAICRGFAEERMCLPYTIDQLNDSLAKVGKFYRELSETRQQLADSERLSSIGQLAAGIAHEVNNPLGIVLMYSHIMLERCTDPSMKEWLQNIVEQSDRCKKIVSGLLNFARQNRVVPEKTGLPELVGAFLKTLTLPPGISAVLENRMRDPEIEVDRDRLIQALTNLVVNAADAMPGGGRVDVRLLDDESAVRIEVADTGSGISAENLPKVFTPFFTTKQIGKGTGLGLAITYGIVRMHKGELKVASNSDPAAGPTGTVFTITLPRGGE